jgi:large subunit ribosomal protein L21
MYAVIKTGGKQYRVAPNDVITIEKIAGEPGDIVELGEVLLLSGDKGVEIGNPLLSGVTIAAEVLRQERGDTIIIFKKRRRHHYRRRNGHRQSLTALKITDILTEGRKPEKRKSEAAKQAPLQPQAKSSEDEAKAATRQERKDSADREKTKAGTARSKTGAKSKPKPKK